MLDKLSIDDFRELIGQEIDLSFANESQSGTVIGVTEAGGQRWGGRAPFSVVVRSGPVDRHWPQGTYTLKHPVHGPLDLFMVPIGPDESGMCYEISFS